MNLSRISALTIALTALLVASCSQKESSVEAIKPRSEFPEAKSVQQKTEHKAPIASYALKPYTPDQYPKTFAKYGSRMAEVEVYRKKAAELASKNQKCREVTAAEISSYKGSVNNMVFWVDCNNGSERFNFTEEELKSGSLAVTQADKAFNKAQGTRLCESLIKNVVTHPSTLEINNFDVGYKKFEPLGNVWVKMKFKAKNGFGTELRYEALCKFQPGNPDGEITVKERSNQS